MNLHHLLCLSGCGYLREVICKNRKVIAQIRAITQYDSRCSPEQDEVWIECEVTDGRQQAHLFELWNSVRAGAQVIVMFKSEYDSFVDVHWGLTPEDPRCFVALKSRLWLLENSLVNGRRAGEDTAQLCAAA